MGKCMYYHTLTTTCTNKFKCTWQDKRRNCGQQCVLNGQLVACRLTTDSELKAMDKDLEQLGITKKNGKWEIKREIKR